MEFRKLIFGQIDQMIIDQIITKEIRIDVKKFWKGSFLKISFCTFKNVQLKKKGLINTMKIVRRTFSNQSRRNPFRISIRV